MIGADFGLPGAGPAITSAIAGALAYAGASARGSARRGLLLNFHWGDALVEPVRDHRGDLEIVLLMHQEVAIAVEADVLKSDEIMLYARLRQEVRVAVRGRGLERRFADHEQDWD